LSTRERLALVAPAIDIAHEGWPDGNPAAALARFRVGYEDDRLVVAFEVEERQFRADEREDNGRVWEDSCVECFLQPGGDGGYYNLECNATGTLLLAHGNDRHGREHAPREVLATIAREARLEVTRRDGEALYRWSLLLVIPRAAFFRHRFAPRPGETARANFYKCGDKLPRPHFLAWNPVVADAPDFHRPECFGRLTFLP
jgi:hypothetical protein